MLSIPFTQFYVVDSWTTLDEGSQISLRRKFAEFPARNAILRSSLCRLRRVRERRLVAGGKRKYASHLRVVCYPIYLDYLEPIILRQSHQVVVSPPKDLSVWYGAFS